MKLPKNNPNLLLSLMVNTASCTVPIVKTTAATPQITCTEHAWWQALILSQGAMHARYCCLFFR